VLIFSLEMSQAQLVMRMMCAEARVNAYELCRHDADQRLWGAFMNAGERLHHLPISINDTSSLSVLDVRAQAKRLQMDRGLAMIVIDYLQLLRPGRRRDSRQQEVSDISRDLKILAKELDVPVLALSQLSREVERRDKHKPQLSDLRDTGAIEQDSDVVLFIARPDGEAAPEEDQMNPHQAMELLIGKQRNGPVGDVKLIFHRAYARFDPAATSYTAGMLAHGAA